MKVLKNHVKEVVKRINDQELLSFIDHLFTTNMWFMFDFTIKKEIAKKYKRFYKAHQGKDINYMAVKNNNLKQTISDP